LIDDRDADYAHLDAASILTDRCWCNGIVLGERTTDFGALDIGNLATRVLVNGHSNDHGTGSALKTQFPKSGDSISYQIAGLGDVSVRVM